MVNITHWGRVTHICIGKLTTIGSDNGLSPGRRQAIIRTIARILLIGPLGTNFSEILIWIQTFSFKKMHLKMSSAKWRLSCLGLNVIMFDANPSLCLLCDKTSHRTISWSLKAAWFVGEIIISSSNLTAVSPQVLHLRLNYFVILLSALVWRSVHIRSLDLYFSSNINEHT